MPGARTALFDGELERDGEKGLAHEEGFVIPDRFGRRLGDDDAAGGVELRCGDLPEGALAHLQVEARHQVFGEFRGPSVETTMTESSQFPYQESRIDDEPILGSVLTLPDGRIQPLTFWEKVLVNLRLLNAKTLEARYFKPVAG